MNEYVILVDEECANLLSALEVIASRINTEGWSTAYGGSGVRIWLECKQPARDIKQILSFFPTAKIISKN
jgi:hypothetical protein